MPTNTSYENALRAFQAHVCWCWFEYHGGLSHVDELRWAAFNHSAITIYVSDSMWFVEANFQRNSTATVANQFTLLLMHNLVQNWVELWNYFHPLNLEFRAQLPTTNSCRSLSPSSSLWARYLYVYCWCLRYICTRTCRLNNIPH